MGAGQQRTRDGIASVAAGPVLYQFQCSQFCAKARWALDLKRISYRTVDLLPGRHEKTIARLAQRTQVPLLILDDQVVQGSDAILTWSDRAQPLPRLTPVGSEDAAMAHEWERSADKHLAVPLRLLFFAHLLPDRSLALPILGAGCSWWTRQLAALTYPALRRRLSVALGLSETAVSAAAQQLERTCEQFEARLEKRRFLAGPVFSRADLATAAALAPCWQAPSGLPPALSAIYDRLRKRPLGRWAEAVHQQNH